MADYRAYSADRKSKSCANCGTVLPIEEYRVKKNHGGCYLNNICRECESDGVDQYRTSTPRGIASEIVRRTKWKCKNKLIPHDLTVGGIISRLDSQEWRCVLTGMPFAHFKKKGEHRRGFAWDSISCDRIKAADGYVFSNVRFVLNAVNLFRNDGNDERMYAIASALMERMPIK